MPIPWIIPAAIYAAQGIAKGVGAIGNRYDVADAETGLGQIRDEQIGFAGQKHQLSTDVSAFGKSSTIDRAQMSYDQLVGSTNLGYQEAISGLEGQLGDLTMQGTSTYGDIQRQTRSRGSGGMAVQSNITTIAQEEKDRLLNRFMSDTSKIQKSMDYTTRRKDLTIGQGKEQLDFTTGIATQEHALNLRQADITQDVTLAGIEEQYQSGLTGLAGIPGAGTKSDFGSFVEGFFS
jgi:hypothetical protein